MYLPGTVNERIGDLRTSRGLQQKELAEMIGVSSSQLSRIENGETTNINADTIAKLAKALRVSTDYILGLTTVSVPKSYDITELGLSEGAVKTLLTLKSSGAAPILNRLLEHKRFPTLIYQIKNYFYDEIAAGVLGRNEIFNMATTELSDLSKEQPEKNAEIRDGVRFINAEKFGKFEIDIERIKNTFMAILRDIKKDIDEKGNLEESNLMANALEQIRAQLPDGAGEPVTAEQIADAVTHFVGQTHAIDDESMEALKNLTQSLLKNSSNGEETPE